MKFSVVSFSENSINIVYEVIHVKEAQTSDSIIFVSEKGMIET